MHETKSEGGGQKEDDAKNVRERQRQQELPSYANEFVMSVSGGMRGKNRMREVT